MCCVLKWTLLDWNRVCLKRAWKNVTVRGMFCYWFRQRDLQQKYSFENIFYIHPRQKIPNLNFASQYSLICSSNSVFVLLLSPTHQSFQYRERLSIIRICRHKDQMAMRLSYFVTTITSKTKTLYWNVPLRENEKEIYKPNGMPDLHPKLKIYPPVASSVYYETTQSFTVCLHRICYKPLVWSITLDPGLRRVLIQLITVHTNYLENGSVSQDYLWPLLLTWFNFNLSMDK